MTPDDCAVERALSVVGAKWTLVVLHHLMEGPRRFSDLQRLIPAASPKMLTLRLRDLEQLGLLTRTIHAAMPPRVEYQLTQQGRSLRPIIASLEKWGSRLRAAKRPTQAVRLAIRVVAALALLAGGVFFFQGIGVLPGSFMTGRSEWAFIGAGLVVGAAALLWLAT